MIDRTDVELLEALCERQLFMVAKEFGQSPEQIRKWSDYDYNRAILHLCTGGETKFTADDIDEVKARIPMADRVGFLLDKDYNFWRRFISESGDIDNEALKKSGYTEEQLPGIAEQMQALGWLGGETAPLPEIEAADPDESA